MDYFNYNNIILIIGSQIRINVSGTRYITYKDTLQKFKERFILRQTQLPEHSRNIQLAHFCLSASSNVSGGGTAVQLEQGINEDMAVSGTVQTESNHSLSVEASPDVGNLPTTTFGLV